MAINTLKWQRTCQECGHKGFYVKPSPDNKRETWRNVKCWCCKSEALDYGQEVEVDTYGHIVPSHLRTLL